jgi:molecular chaperone GrpE
MSGVTTGATPEPAGPGDGVLPDSEAPVDAGSDASDVVADASDVVAESADVVAEADPVVEADVVAESADVVAEADPVVEAERERDEYRDALVRLQADFENYRKRILKQQTEHLERAAANLVDKLLPVLDTADLALAHGGGEEVKQVSAALAAALEREGLVRIDPLGAPFDPTIHEAVALEPGDGGEQEVVEVMRAGYSWKGRVLRPAMVKVRG